MERITGTTILPSFAQPLTTAYPTNLTIASLLVLASNLMSSSASAQDSQSFFGLVEPKSKNEPWINPGMASYHFDLNKNFNGSIWVLLN